MEDGASAVTNSVRNSHPQDMRGLKMRTEEHPAHIKFPMPSGPVRSHRLGGGLHIPPDRVADGQYNALPIIVLGKALRCKSM